ncbi:MAG: hypothetical protein NVS3B19_15630 [Ginsengibacter sp.]
MVKVILLIIVYILVISCNNKKNIVEKKQNTKEIRKYNIQTDKQTGEAEPFSTDFSWGHVEEKGDTLWTYIGNDSLLAFADPEKTLNYYSKRKDILIKAGYRYEFKILNLNLKKFALIIEKDSIKIYKYKDGYFYKSNSFFWDFLDENSISKYSIADFNFDGYKDLSIGSQYSNGNFEDRLFFYKPNTGNLDLKDFDFLMNVEADAKNHLIRSRYYASYAYGVDEKDLYRYNSSKDSLILVASAQQDRNTSGNTIIVKKIINGRQINDTMNLKRSKAEKVFSKLLWEEK